MEECLNCNKSCFLKSHIKLLEQLMETGNSHLNVFVEFLCRTNHNIYDINLATSRSSIQTLWEVRRIEISFHTEACQNQGKQEKMLE